MYALTVPEMARLRRGYRLLNEVDETAHAATPEQRARAANPNRTPPGQPRSGDYAALERFADENGLRKN